MYDRKDLPDLIRHILSNREPHVISDLPPNYKHAGVLIPLLFEDDMHKVIFTKRTDTVEHHKGQISFPGGATDDGDRSTEETALRESQEEIGLDPEDVDILGRIDDSFTVASSFIVHPYVGFVSRAPVFRISRVEVERVLKVPWNTLVRDYLENRTYTVESEGMIYETPAFEHNGDVIWGATARMMENFIEILNQK